VGRRAGGVVRRRCGRAPAAGGGRALRLGRERLVPFGVTRRCLLHAPGRIPRLEGAGRPAFGTPRPDRAPPPRGSATSHVRAPAGPRGGVGAVEGGPRFPGAVGETAGGQIESPPARPSRPLRPPGIQESSCPPPPARQPPFSRS